MRTGGWTGLVAAVATLVVTAPGAQAAPSSIAQLERSLQSGRTTCGAVVDRALDRLRAVNRTTRAVIQVNPDARSIARSLDARKRAGRRLAPLHCVPILVKDNYQTADSLQTTAGSVVMRGFRASTDAFVVRRLRAEGMVVLGKTNMDEWAHGTAGYSSLGGQTANGLRTNRQPAGSSGGSASGVASGIAPIATGSDTGGSIQGPAAWNGVVGLRPTVGLISRAGIIPYASFTDTPGPLTRSVADLAAVLGTWTGVDPADPATEAPHRVIHDYTRFLNPRGGLRGARIGVMRSLFGIDLLADNPGIASAYDAAVARMRRAGARLVDPLSLDAPPEAALEGLGLITTSQFKAELDDWFRGSGRKAPVHSLADVVQASEQPDVRNKVLVLPALEGSVDAPPPEGPGFDAAVAETDTVRDAVLRLMRDNRLDALVYPPMTCPAPPLPRVVDPTYSCLSEGDQVTQPLELGEAPGALPEILSPLVRLPALTLPAGRLPGGLQLGINFLGPAWSEGRLIRFGSAFEAAR